jgi:protein-S-isoprenylcysteine O-methyltransferase Ste14
MVNVLGWAINTTLVVWLATEVVMQVRQYRMGGRAKLTEWGSLGVIVLSFLVGALLARTAVRVLPSPRLPAHSALLGVTLLLMLLGIGFRLWAIHTLGRFFRGVVHIQADHEVISNGPYRLLRHPSYAGMLVAFLGLGLTYGNWAALVVFMACGTAGVLYRIRVEERVLLAALGDAYRDYAATTARLVPHVW